MSIEYTIKDNFDYVLEEKGNTYISLRKLCWCGADEAEEREGKLDVRKYYTGKDGNEVVGKGVSLTEEGANELVNVLTSNNYGDTKTIINNIKDREDFMPSLVNCLSGEQLEEAGVDPSKYEKEDYYDPRKDLFDEEVV